MGMRNAEADLEAKVVLNGADEDDLVRLHAERRRVEGEVAELRDRIRTTGARRKALEVEINKLASRLRRQYQAKAMRVAKPLIAELAKRLREAAAVNERLFELEAVFGSTPANFPTPLRELRERRDTRLARWLRDAEMLDFDAIIRDGEAA